MDSSHSTKVVPATDATQTDTVVSREEVSETQHNQPRILRYQDILDAIKKEKSENSVGEDFFPCKDGFYSHSLSA